MVDLKKLTTFTISEKRKITFTIDNREIIFEIPFVLGVNPALEFEFVGMLIYFKNFSKILIKFSYHLYPTKLL